MNDGTDSSITNQEENAYSYSFNFPGIRFGTLLKSHPLLKNITANKDKFAKEFEQQYKLQKAVFLKQVHSNSIYDVKIDSEISRHTEGDGLITNLSNVALIAFHADCQIAFFIDPKKKVVAIAHAGFRGQTLEAYTECIRKMNLEYNCLAHDLIVIFAPSLSQRHAEFVNYKQEFPQHLWKYKNCENCFDLKSMAKDELLKSGVIEKNIFLNPTCTFEDELRFNSYRRDKTQDRNASYILLN